MMKKITILSIVLFLLVVISGCTTESNINKVNKNGSETPAQNNTQNKDAIIKGIKEKVKAINNEEDYQIKKLDNEWFVSHDFVRDAGTQIDGYYKQNNLKKIVERIGLSFEVRTYEYYYSDGGLILIHEKNEIFPYNEETGIMDRTRLELAFEGDYYINNNDIVDIITSGEKRTPEKVSEKEFVSSLILSSKENVELLLKYDSE